MKRILVACVATVLLPAVAARAQVLLSVEGGASSSGLVQKTAFTTQGQLSVWSAGWFGVEGDYSFAAKTRGGLFGDHIRTVMADVLVGPRSADDTWRVYGAVGVGLIGAVARLSDVFTVSDAHAQNDFGMNAGGGVLGFFSDRWGVRVDARYFRDLKKTEGGSDNHFLRVGAGVALRF